MVALRAAPVFTATVMEIVVGPDPLALPDSTIQVGSPEIVHGQPVEVWMLIVTVFLRQNCQ